MLIWGGGGGVACQKIGNEMLPIYQTVGMGVTPKSMRNIGFLKVLRILGYPKGVEFFSNHA